MTNSATQTHGSTNDARTETVTVTPSNWVKPELITINDDGIDGKSLNGGETVANYQGPS